MNNRGLVLLGISLASGLVLSVLVASTAFYNTKKLDNVISVTGSAQQKITSDVVKWKASFVRNVSPAEVAVGYKNIQSDFNIIEKYLKDNKIVAAELSISPANMQPMYSYYNGSQTLTGYIITQRLEVQSSDIAKVTELEKRAPSELSARGLTFTNDGEEFYYTKFSDLKVAMLAEATKNAQKRADEIAKSTGRAVGDLKSADMGVFQVTAVNSVDVNDYGSYDTSALEKQVTAVVRGSFYIK
jgi:hypothetical protein